MERARIVIAERWAVLRRGLDGLLSASHDVVADVEDVVAATAILGSRPVDLVVVGLESGGDGAAAVTTLLGTGSVTSGAPVVVALTDDVGADDLRALLRAGARGVFAKRVSDDDLLDGLARIVAGDRIIDQRFLPLLYGGGENGSDPVPGTDDSESLLTPREREVLAELARGRSNREIAASLFVGESTVKTHLGRIYAKLEVDDRHRAVGRALELGLLH